MIVTFTHLQLMRMPRPPEYLSEMMACAVAVTDNNMSFDTDLPCYRALLIKYRGTDQPPTRPLPPQNLEGYDPETDPQSPRVGGCCDPPRE